MKNLIYHIKELHKHIQNTNGLYVLQAYSAERNEIHNKMYNVTENFFFTRHIDPYSGQRVDKIEIVHTQQKRR